MPGFSAPKVEALGFYKTLVPLNQIIWHHNPKDSNFYCKKQASKALMEIW
jgi:hypothetical protein